MAKLPPVIRQDHLGTSLVFDLRQNNAEPVHFGRSLRPDEDLIVYCDAMRRGRHASQVDSPVPRSILPHSGWGEQSAPAVVLQRGGKVLTLRLELVEVVPSTEGLNFVHLDPATGVQIEVRWHIAEPGLIRTECCLTNTADTPANLVELA